jgi:hypothetical protein
MWETGWKHQILLCICDIWEGVCFFPPKEWCWESNLEMKWAVRNGVCMGFCHSCQKKPPPTDFVRALHPVNHGLWTMVCGGGNLQCCVVIWFFKYNPRFLVLKIIQNPRTAAFQFQFFFFLTKNQNPRIVFCNYLRNIKAPTVIKMGYLFI